MIVTYANCFKNSSPMYFCVEGRYNDWVNLIDGVP